MVRPVTMRHSRHLGGGHSRTTGGAMQKNRRIPAPEEVLRIFDDNCIEVLAKQANLSWAANVPRFAAGVPCAARQYVADHPIPSDRALRDQINALYSAANLFMY